MSFEETRLPVEISRDSRGGPGYNTSVIKVDSGAEFRVSHWSTALRRYQIGYGIASLDLLDDVLELYTAMLGSAIGFRYKDWQDYTSAANHRDAPSDTDQTLGTGDGSTTQFQLVKTYTRGSLSRTRVIEKPVSGTVVVSKDDISQASGWSIDTTTGIVTFTTAPANGEVVKAGFEFDVPVRFSEEIDDSLLTSVAIFDAGSIPNIPLVEIRGTTAIPADFYAGGANESTFAANFTLNLTDGLLQTLSADSTGLSVLCPDPANYEPGNNYWTVVNSGSNAFTVRDNDSNSLVALAANEACEIVLTVDASSNKVWGALA